MDTIEYFKQLAKNLHKDFKTQKPYFDSSLGDNLFEYSPKFFDVDALITDFEIDEENFSLMNAQHVIAKLVGFKKWTEMVSASQEGLELAKLLFDNMHKIRNEEWEYYVLNVENENNLILDDGFKLEIFKTVFADVDGHQSDGYEYRLVRDQIPQEAPPISKPLTIKPMVQISTLPLVGNDRKEFIQTANSVFEHVLDRIEPEYPDMVRKLWNAEKYIDEILLNPDMLPIDRDYALSLLDAFLVHHVIALAVETED